MANFPDLGNPKNGMKVSNVNKVLTSEYMGNYKQKRKSATRSRKTFDCNYSLETIDYNTLETFFNDNIGLSFSFTHPINATVHECTFMNETLEATYVTSELVDINIQIEEV